MNRLGPAALVSTLLLFPSLLMADYQKGDSMFQIYGGGAAISGRYHQPGVDRDEQDYADVGSVVGGQFLYYLMDAPCIAVGADISHGRFDVHDSRRMLANRYTESSAASTSGLLIARLVYPKGRSRPYVQGGLGLHHTRLKLEGTPINASPWSDTVTSEKRTLLDDGHVGVAFQTAAGIHVYLTKRLFLGAEYKVLHLTGPSFKPTSAGVQEQLLSAHGSVAQSGVGLLLGLGF